MSDVTKKGPGIEIASFTQYQSIMKQLEKKTVAFEFGFIGSKGAKPNELKPVFIVDDSHFPYGNPNTDIGGWEYHCSAIAHHVIFDMVFENDRTHEKRNLVINICPFELLNNKLLTKQMEQLVSRAIEFGTGKDAEANQYLDTFSAHKVELMIMGKQMSEFLKAGISQPPANYHRMGAHLGRVDLKPLIVIMLSLKMDDVNAIQRTTWTKFCMYCRNYFPNRAPEFTEKDKEGLK